MLNFAVIGIWAAVLLAVVIRIGLLSHSHDVFQTYVEAGRKWTAAQPLYTYTRGFVYSPLVAAFFALFSWFPVSLGSVLWRLLTAAIFIWAIFWWLKAEINRRIPESSYWLVFLLILPLSLGNFNNGQVNPMIIGLLMIAIVAAHEKRWTLSAVALGFSTYLKIYPLSVGLLLVLLYPRQLGWRLLLTLILMGALSFILQRPAYVLEQYQRWFHTRAADDRRLNMDIAPRDFAMLLQTAAHSSKCFSRAALADVSRCGSSSDLRGRATVEVVRTTSADLRIQPWYLLDAALRTRDRRCDLRDDRPAPGIRSGPGLSSEHRLVDAHFSLRFFCFFAARLGSKRIFRSEEDPLPDVGPAVRGASLCRLCGRLGIFGETCRRVGGETCRRVGV